MLASLKQRGVKVDMDTEGTCVIEMRAGKKCQYAVIQLESVEEREKAVTIHHDEAITEKFTVTAPVEGAEYGDIDTTNPFGALASQTVQLYIKPYRQRGEKRVQ